MKEDFINYNDKKVILTESTANILKAENIEMDKKKKAEEIVTEVNKTKKAVAKINESGDVVIKQSLNG